MKGGLMATSNEKKARSKSIVLAVAALAVVAVAGATIGRARRGNENGRDAARANLVTLMGSTGAREGSLQEGEMMAIADGTGIVATATTGVYYLPGTPSKCFKVQANPHGSKSGFNVEPADTLRATMISAIGIILVDNSTALMGGKMMVWNDLKIGREVLWTYLDESMIIDGVTYWRRAATASWQCETGFTYYHAYHARKWNTTCQWLKLNGKTGGFLNYYTASLPLFAAGGGWWNLTTATGQLAGYHQMGKGSYGYKDGVYDLTWDNQPPGAILLWWNITTKKRAYDGIYDFVRKDTCVSAEYPLSVSHFGSCSAEARHIFGTGWKLVRRVGPSHKMWHPASDLLGGSDVYGSPGATDTDDKTFSVQFNTTGFNQFLFTTGDCANWVLTSKNSVLSGSYANAPRTACATSARPRQPSQVKWYHRTQPFKILSDPWVGVMDHWDSVRLGLLVYGEFNFPNGGHNIGEAKEIVPRNGANVYIRTKASPDANGC